MSEHRRCESCGGAMPKRTHRQRNQKGNLVCDSCSDSLSPSWGSYAALNLAERSEMQRREAEALTSVKRVSRIQTEAHDSGDGALINHCPFCGSGSVTGRSDGSAECDFCNNVFTVQVQPPHPNMPQTVDGQPVTPPGMPGGQDTEISGTDDPSVHETEDGVAANPLDEQDPTKAKKPNPFAKGGPPAKGAPPQGSPPAGDKKKSAPPWLKNKKSFRTATGAVLPAEDYMAHLALSFADDREAVLDTIRVANVERQAAVPEPDTSEYDDPTGYVTTYPALRGVKCTIRTTNGGQFKGKVHTHGSTYPMDVEMEDGHWVPLLSHRIKEIRIEEGEHKTAAHPDYPNGVPYECPTCGNYRTKAECTVCNSRKDKMREPGMLDLLFNNLFSGLFPSGATASERTALVDPKAMDWDDLLESYLDTMDTLPEHRNDWDRAVLDEMNVRDEERQQGASA